KSGTPLTFTPLIETSPQSGDIPAGSLQFAQPEDIAKQLTPSGKKILAALVTGKFKTAFPDGAPADEEKKDETGEAVAPSPPALKESSASSTLLVIADTDWLFDDFGLRKFNFFGQTAAEPFNDNLA